MELINKKSLADFNKFDNPDNYQQNWLSVIDGNIVGFWRFNDVEMSITYKGNGILMFADSTDEFHKEYDFHEYGYIKGYFLPNCLEDFAHEVFNHFKLGEDDEL